MARDSHSRVSSHYTFRFSSSTKGAFSRVGTEEAGFCRCSWEGSRRYHHAWHRVQKKKSQYNRARGREWIKTYVNVLRMIYECQDCQDCRWQCCWMRRSKAVPATRNPRQSRSVSLALSFPLPLLFFLSLFSPRFLFFFFSSKYVVLDFMLPACRCCFCLCLSFLHNCLLAPPS